MLCLNMVDHLLVNASDVAGVERICRQLIGHDAAERFRTEDESVPMRLANKDVHDKFVQRATVKLAELVRAKKVSERELLAVLDALAEAGLLLQGARDQVVHGVLMAPVMDG